jgi:LPXTG-motif cell wall-anchored protein
MLKKKISLMIVVLVLFMQDFSGMGLIKQANASAIGVDIMTGVTMTVKDSHGVTVTDSIYEQGSDVTLNYTWAIPNGHSYHDQDTYTFTVPNAFKLFNDITNSGLLFDGNPVGTFSVDKDTNVVVMTFNSFIEQYDDVQGTLTFNSKFDTAHIIGSTEQQISFPINSGIYTATVYFKPNVSSTIEKKGSPSSFNAKKIDWTVDINKALDTVQNAVVTDPTPVGLDTPSVVSVTYLNVALNGTTTPGVILDPSNYRVTIVGGEIKVEFIGAAAVINTAYRITYSTSILDAGSSYTNKAFFSGTNQASVNSSATVDIQRGTHLAKSSTGYNSATQTIDWEIKFNYDETNIAQAAARVTDLFENSQDLVPGSIEVHNLSLGSAGTEDLGSALTLNSDYTITPVPSDGTNQGFTLAFLHDLNSAYQIVYQTKSIDRVEGDTRIDNTVTSNTYHAEGHRDIIQSVMTKSFNNVDYMNKTVDWHIAINKDSYTMKNVVVTDTFYTGGLELIPNSLVVRDKNGVNVPNVLSSVYVVISPDNKAGFTVSFTPDLSELYTISYKTKFNNDWLTSGSNFINKAHIEWNTVTIPINHSKDVTSTFTPRNEWKNNGFKNGSYNAETKEITWTVGMNYNGKDIVAPVLTDTLLEGQELVVGSIKLFAMNIPVNGNPSKGTSVASNFSNVNLNTVTNTVYVHFTNPINSPYYVEFKTSLAGKLIDNQITNIAHLYDGTALVSGNLSASVNVPHAGEYVYKDGKQEGSKIKWTLDINRGQSEVQQATILDEPSNNQALIPESFHLFATTVDSDGTVTKNSGLELLKDADYTLVINTNGNGVQSLVLTFLHTITTAFVLEYQSEILANNNDHVTNAVKFTGNNVTTVVKQTSKDIIVGVSSGSGTGSGVRGTLTVSKVDQGDHTIVLNGATFVLYRDLDLSRSLINTLTTGSEGKIVFENLLSGNYVLIETLAPDGYVLDSNEHKVLVNSSQTVVNLEVTNEKSPTPTSTPTSGSVTPVNQSSAPTATPTVTPTATPVSTPTAPVATPELSPAVIPTATPTAIIVDEVPLGVSPIVDTLPKTGETSHLNIQVAGVFLILLGFVLRRRILKRR